MLGSQPDAENWPTWVRQYHGRWLDGGDVAGNGQSSTGGWSQFINVSELVWRASSAVGGSPWEFIEPYDPETVISNLEDKRDAFATAVDELAPTTDIEGFIDAAVTKYDASLAAAAHINDVVAEFETDGAAAFQRDVSSINDGMWSIGAAINIQLPQALANLANERQAKIAGFRARLELMHERDRSQVVGHIADMMARLHLGKVQAQQTVVSQFFDVGRFRIAAKQDEIGIAAEYEERDTLWDLDLTENYSKAMQSIFGASLIPRNQTKGERIMGAVGTALNAGLQGAVNFGSPQAGLASFLGVLGINLLGELDW